MIPVPKVLLGEHFDVCFLPSEKKKKLKFFQCCSELPAGMPSIILWNNLSTVPDTCKGSGPESSQVTSEANGNRNRGNW